MWGRLATCGRVALGLVGICTLVGRPSGTRPQDTILPHEFRSIPNAGKTSGIAHPAYATTSGIPACEIGGLVHRRVRHGALAVLLPHRRVGQHLDEDAAHHTARLKRLLLSGLRIVKIG